MQLKNLLTKLLMLQACLPKEASARMGMSNRMFFRPEVFQLPEDILDVCKENETGYVVWGSALIRTMTSPGVTSHYDVSPKFFQNADPIQLKNKFSQYPQLLLSILENSHLLNSDYLRNRHKPGFKKPVLSDKCTKFLRCYWPKLYGTKGFNKEEDTKRCLESCTADDDQPRKNLRGQSPSLRIGL